MNHYLIINILIILFFVYSFFAGIKKGFLYQIASLLGLLLALYISNRFSSIFAQRYEIWPKVIDNVQYQALNTVFYPILNKTAWFIVIFIVISILFAFLKKAVQFLRNIPILKSINNILGGLMGIVIANINLLIMVLILQLPLIKNGQNIVENTLLNNLVGFNANLIQSYYTPEIQENILSNLNYLTDSDKAWLETFLDENDSHIKEYIQFED